MGVTDENHSGGGFKETTVMQRRQLEERAFLPWKSVYEPGFFGDTGEPPIGIGLFFFDVLNVLLDAF